MNEIFKQNIDIISSSLDSIDMEQFNKLLSEMEQTLRAGKKIITSGLGKNVPVCDKFTGMMLSLGFDASFLHTNTAVHGDLGMVRPGDLVVVLTKSGSTAESVYLSKLLKQREGVNVWLFSFKHESPIEELLGKDKCLVAELEHEGDLWNIVPNNSTTLSLIVLQTLATELAKRFELELNRDFKPNHPGGAIGAELK